MRTYGQFCPVARASELLAERWTPIIISEPAQLKRISYEQALRSGRLCLAGPPETGSLPG